MAETDKLKNSSTYYNEQSLKNIVRAIIIAQGEFSLILVRCNYTAQLRIYLSQKLQRECPYNCDLIVIPHIATRLYSVIESKTTKATKALIITGFELVSDINQLLISTNQDRNQYSKNFLFPLVLLVTDKVLIDLYRVAPHFTNCAAPPIDFNLSAYSKFSQ